MKCPWCGCDVLHYLDSSGCAHERGGLFSTREPVCYTENLENRVVALERLVKALEGEKDK